MTASILLSLALAANAGAGYGGVVQLPDTITMREVYRILDRYYSPLQQSGLEDWAQLRNFIDCAADRGELCFGGDPGFQKCPPDVRCGNSSNPERLIQPLLSAARAHPEAGFVTGQTVYALVIYGRHREAMELALGCRAEAWWCQFLKGHVLHAAGSLEEAEEAFRAALSAAPDTVRYQYLDATRLLGSWLQTTGQSAGSDEWRKAQDLSRSQRVALSDTLLWLADPLYSVPGNDRWVEHVNRALQYHINVSRAETRESHPFVHGWWQSSMHRRGHADSWRWLPRQRGIRSYTGTRATRYHFVPDLEGVGFSQPTWRLEAGLDDEGYTPPYGTFHELPAQIARFRDGDSVRLAVAGTLARTELADAAGSTAHLVLSSAPDRFPLRLMSDFEERRVVFVASTLPQRFVLSYEVLSDARFGRHRVMLEPLILEGAGLSDVLLYRPSGIEPPDALSTAAPLMLGETVIERGNAVGLYWETYGAPQGTPVQVELEVEAGRSGFLTRVRGLFGSGGARSSRQRWSEPSTGLVFGRGLELDLRDLDPGSYTLVLRMSWEGQSPIETRRSFEVR